MDLYVYYRVPCEHAQALQTQVTKMQAGLSNNSGIAVALKRCPEETDGRHTWMEVYFGIPQGFDAALAQAVRQAGLDKLIDGARHAEYFMDIAPCA